MNTRTLGRAFLLAGSLTGMVVTIALAQDESLDRTADQLTAASNARLEKAKRLLEQILAVNGPPTIENTLEPFNAMWIELDAAESEASLLNSVHPDKAVRDAGDAAEQEVSKFTTDLSLNRALYEAVKAVDARAADAATRQLARRTLRDFRRAGVDKDDETRARIKAINGELVKIGQDFDRNIREDVRHIELGSADELEGLPEDFIRAHQPGGDGKIRITTDYPDYIPFMTYAENGEARRKLYTQFRLRGHPKNLDVLGQLLAERYELAKLLGYANYADYITEDKMIGSDEAAAAFIQRVAEVARKRADEDYAALLARRKKDDPRATAVNDWEKAYYAERVKTEQYSFDSQAARNYFEFQRVKQGLFTITGELFGVEYRPVKNLKLWHEDVEAWDLYEGQRHLGRFYLDLFPRPNKYTHAACFDYRSGVEGVEIPQKVLVCNFPDPKKTAGPALLTHDEVETFFHEFGHLLHGIFGGHQKWIGISGITTEWDFVEAPSQMLQEWIWDTVTLQRFARHHATGEPIPAELVERMRAARDFGKGMDAAQQMFYASVSLNYYNRDPREVDTTAYWRDTQNRMTPFRYVEGTYPQCGFGHLHGYSAVYYTYMWSLVIAKDLFSRFEQKGLMDRDLAMRYRRTILDPGGSKDAAELVRDFLGRDFGFDAYEAWLTKR